MKITGVGPVTPAGVGVEAFWRGITARRSWVRPFSLLDDRMGPLVAAQVPNNELKRIIAGLDVPRGVARHSLFAVAGSLLALTDAGIELEKLRSQRLAVVSGSSLLDFGGIGKAISAVNNKGAKAAQARVVYTTTLTAVPQLICSVLGVEGRTLSIQSSCCSGMDAIGQAALMVESGEVDLAICGGGVKRRCISFRS